MKTHRSVRLAVLLVAAAALAPSAARAQFVYGQGRYASKWELTPFAGGYFGSDIYSASGASRLHMEDSWTYGGRLAYFLRSGTAFEVAYARANSDMVATNAIGVQQRKFGTVNLDQIDFNGLFSGSSGAAGGYFSFGLGMSIVSPHVTVLDSAGASINAPSSTKFALNFGLGGKYYFGDRFGLRVDGRLRSTDLGRTVSGGVWCDYYGCWSYASSWYTSGEVTGGLIVRF